MHCLVPEKIHPHPMEGHWKFLGGERVLKAKFIEEMYENKLAFPGGRGCKTKTFRGGGGSTDIFWNCTFSRKLISNLKIIQKNGRHFVLN